MFEGDLESAELPVLLELARLLGVMTNTLQGAGKEELLRHVLRQSLG